MVPIARFCPKSKGKINLPLRMQSIKAKQLSFVFIPLEAERRLLSQSFGKILVSKMKEMLHVKCKRRCSKEISRSC